MTLQTVNWQTEGDGHFTAMASYSGSATSSYVKGYTVTADYAGTVSRINLNKIRYVAIFEGTALDPAPGENTGDISDSSAPPDRTDPTGQETQTGEMAEFEADQKKKAALEKEITQLKKSLKSITV